MEINRIFGQLPRLDAVRLSGGGEPFLRADLPEIARLAQVRLRPWLLHVTTNGFLTERIVRFCEGRSREMPLRLLVSLDGMREKHNAVRGRGTAFDQAVETLRALVGRRTELRLHLSVNQTVVEEYRRLREFLRPLGVRNQVVMASEISATYSLQPDLEAAPHAAGEFTTFGSFTSAAVTELLDEAERDAESLSGVDAAVRQRDWVRRCPGCWAECEVLPSAIYSGDILGEFLRIPLGRSGRGA